MNDRQEIEARILELEAAQQAGRRRSRRLVGTNIALAVAVLAFGGMSAAYALAPANSVNSASIIDRSIGTPDVKVGAFAGQTILDNSMTGLDINESTLAIPGDVIVDDSLKGADIDESSLSIAGRLTNIAQTYTGEVSAAPNVVTTSGLTCPAGKQLVSGGAFNESGSLILTSSYPDYVDRTWRIRYKNPTANAETFYVHAVCANIS